MLTVAYSFTEETQEKRELYNSGQHCSCQEIAQKGNFRSKPILPTGMKACWTSFCTQKESSKEQDLGVEAEYQQAEHGGAKEPGPTW